MRKVDLKTGVLCCPLTLLRDVILLMSEQWRCMQCPMKFTESPEQLDWSKHVESVRKDVECFFGRLKRRFGFLRSSVEYQSKSVIDNAFYSCCILHNMLHEFDRLGDWHIALDESRAAGIPLNDAMLYPDVVHQEEVDYGHSELRSKLIDHFAAVRETGEVVWLRS